MQEAEDECEPEWCDAEDPLFILYTSGSTGKPKASMRVCVRVYVYLCVYCVGLRREFPFVCMRVIQVAQTYHLRVWI